MSHALAFRIQLTDTLHIHTTPDVVFPLLCPVREHDWIPGWTGVLVYSASGIAENNCVFTSHSAERGDETWVISRYEPAQYVVEFVRMNPGNTVTKLDLALEAAEAGTARLHWSEVITALSAEGEALARARSHEVFAAQMRHVTMLLNHYCTTGEMLRPGE